MNTNKQTGDTTMNESYKDKFNATMEQFGIDSLDDLKSNEEKKKFFKAVDKSHDAVNESATDELMSIAEEMKEGGKGSGPQMNPGAGARKGSAADGGQTDDESDDYDDKGVMKKEEVVTEAVSDAYVKQIARMTDRNDHFGARVELARMMKDKELMQMYDSLEKMHRMNLGGNDALTLRSKLDKNLKFRLTKKVKKDADRLMGAL